MLSRLIERHALAMIAVVLAVSCGLLGTALLLHRWPSFDDPLLGFEVRATEIAKRINSWKLLLESSSWSGSLSLYPDSGAVHAVSAVSDGTQSTPSTDLDEERRQQIENIESKQFRARIHNLTKNRTFCGKIFEDYAHIIVESKDGSDLLSANSLKELCQMDRQFLRLEDSDHNELFSGNCEHKSEQKCCESWSLANYVALIGNKSSCLDIDDRDVNTTKSFLQYCAPFYYNFQLSDDCDDEPIICKRVPKECLKFENAVFNIMHYLADYIFLNPNHLNSSTIRYTSVFLPIAKSSKLLPYFNRLTESNLYLNNIRVIAMDLGLKHTLFDKYILHDTIYLLIAAFIILVSLCFYTASILITLITVATIASSLGVAYFFYMSVYQLTFFPFMNLMAIVISIGIGSDNSMIYCKVWECSKADKTIQNKAKTFTKLIEDTLSHAWVSVLAASATTSAAFFSGFFSHITSIKCFSIFAGTAVIANFIITMLSLPPAVVISDKSSLNYFNKFTFLWRFHSIINIISKSFFERILYNIIVKFRYIWIILFGSIAFASVIIVTFKPKLQLPDSEEFQLFSANHYFERYDFKFKNEFWFKRAKEKSESYMFLMPIRVVFGVKAADNGDYLNPISRGSLQLVDDFDATSVNAQIWLLQFCKEIRNQSFYKPTIGPLLSNCFIETFKSWMDDRRCEDAINPNLNRAPCCQTSTFPYSKNVFNLCLSEAIKLLHRTPNYLLNMNWAGPRFDKKSSKIMAAVIEYDSIYSFSHSYIEMNQFWSTLNEWVSDKLKTAPNELKSGWFVSHGLDFYALQVSLAEGTIKSIYFAVFFSFIALILTTWNIKLSLISTLTISCVIFTTVGILILLNWRLNVLESITISLTIGLAVDLTLHYTIAYKLSMQNNVYVGVKYALCRIGSPVAMAAITTTLAGMLMLFSSILAYVQIGTFLIVLSIVSWIYSTIFHLSLLSIFVPKELNSRVDPLLYCCLLCNDSNQVTSAVRSSTIDSISIDFVPNKKHSNLQTFSDSTISSSSPTNSSTFQCHTIQELRESERIIDLNN